jgi:hypothetical protein
MRLKPRELGVARVDVGDAVLRVVTNATARGPALPARLDMSVETVASGGGREGA